jgi:hypothetical protein
MRHRRIGQSAGFVSLAFIVVLAGCGSPSVVANPSSSPGKEAGPSAKPAGSDGTVKSGGIAPASAPTAPAKLADTLQLVSVLDLSKLPLPVGATPGNSSATQLHVAVPLAVPAAIEFYRGKLDALGWKPAGPKSAETITDSFAQLSVGKDGYLLQLMGLSSKPNEASITIQHLGNLDSRTLPRVEGAEDQYSCQSNSFYFTTANVEAATAALRRLLQADGWQEYDQAFSQKAVRPDAADLLFHKKIYSLVVSISKPATQPAKSAVQILVTTLAHDLPAPPDARKVEIEDSQWKLMCEIPRDLAEVADYYRSAMKETGFPSPPIETPFGQSLTLSFESAGHDLVVVSLTATGEHSTQVKLEGYSAAFREAMKKAEVLAAEKREAQKKADAALKAEMIKAHEAAAKQQEGKIQDAIDSALKGATQPGKPSDISQKIQAEVKAKLDKGGATGTPADQPGNNR